MGLSAVFTNDMIANERLLSRFSFVGIICCFRLIISYHLTSYYWLRYNFHVIMMMNSCITSWCLLSNNITPGQFKFPCYAYLFSYLATLCFLIFVLDNYQVNMTEFAFSWFSITQLQWFLPIEGGYLEPEAFEKTYRYEHQSIVQEVDLLSSRKPFDMILPGNYFFFYRSLKLCHHSYMN